MRRASSPQSIRWRQESRSPNGSRVFRDERLSASASVYHYLEYPHALSIFSEDRLRLADPMRWSDPYEHGWCKTVLDRPSPLHQASAYALCWSRSRFDEPAWRMAGFQRTNPIIRIRCRVRDILAAARALAEQRPGTFFAGKVCYEREEELWRRAKSALAADVKEVSRMAANLLLRKRNALRFEKEVRTLWLDREPKNTALFLPIDAKSVVRQVMCSPHVHPDQRAKIHQEFKERFGIEVIDPGVLHPAHEAGGG
jgi:hypothetical protein